MNQDLTLLSWVVINREM